MGKKDKKREEQERLEQEEILRVEAERARELEEAQKLEAERQEQAKGKKKKKRSKTPKPDEASNLEEGEGAFEKKDKQKYPTSTTDTDRPSAFSDDQAFGESFKDKKIRSKFIRKVYSILSLQLGYTMAFNFPFLYLDELQEFVYDYPWVIWIAVVLFLFPYFMLVCCESTRRNFPTNLILFFIMTQGMAGVCGFFTAKLDTEVVFYAFVLTLVVTVCIMIIAVVCPFDFGSCLMIGCVVVVVLLAFAATACVIFMVTGSKILNLVYAGICVVLFSIFLLFDTQAIIGGKRIRLNPEEYLLGAIQVYVDIVEVFLNFLELIGACTEND